MKKFLFFFAFFLLFFTFFPFSQSFASSISLPTVTVINPIRGNALGHDNENLLPGLQAQWQVTHDANINATWLWQYSALENQPLVAFAKKEMHNQEFGLFLEIDRNFSNKSGVQFRGIGPWYFSNGLLLISYDNLERKKFIDTAFAKFKNTFGYYPKTVGAWWIGADSLTYMQEHYGITSAMKAADQYNLDVYTIWGSPWGIPYIASTTNEGIPAAHFADSSKVVVMQWAARDPLQAYGPTGSDGQFGTQDFEVKGYDISYFDYLLSIYLHHPLDQIIVGLENSKPSAFSLDSHYPTVIREIAKLQKENKLHVALAKEYAQSFLSKKIILPPTRVLLTKSFDSNDQVFWYQSSNYRLSIQKRGNQLYLVDMRNYTEKTPEAFFTLPNSQGNLLVDTPALVDCATWPQQRQFLGISTNSLTMSRKNGSTVLKSDNTIIGIFSDTSAKILINKSTNIFFESLITYPSPFVFLAILFTIYIVAFYLTTKNIHKTLLALIAFIPLCIAYPFLQQYPTLFDKKELLLSYIFLIPSLALPAKLFLLPTLPFIFLLLFHYISYRLQKMVLFFLASIVLTVFFLHLPYFPLDGSTYKSMAISIFLIFLLVFGIIVFFILKFRTKKIIFLTLGSTCMFVIFSAVTILFSRSTEIITPFEMDSLQVVYQQKQPVMYLLPKDVPIYKAIRPLLYDNISFAQRLTQTQWSIIKRDAKNNLQLPKTHKTLLIIPRYVGSYIYPEEIEKYHLQTIFDNMKISIFEEK